VAAAVKPAVSRRRTLFAMAGVGVTLTAGACRRGSASRGGGEAVTASTGGTLNAIAEAPPLVQPAPDEPGAASVPDYLAWACPGPYLAPTYGAFDVVRRGSFGARQRVAVTYFFYWYDAAYLRLSRAARGGTSFYPFTPVNHETMSFRDPAWFLKEFQDMQDAGIDAALPVYWGEPGQYNRRVAPAPELNLFSTEGLPPMVQALDTLRAAGRPFKIGMFFDTTILDGEDLTTERGRAIFYTTIRDYFSRIPPEHWAAIGGRPLVWLYDAQRVAAFDQRTFDEVYRRFPQDFGGLVPYIVRELQWYFSRVAPPQPVIRADGLYVWGAAPFGFNDDPRLTVAQVGPGFCNTQFGGGGPNRFCVEREDGRRYQRELERAIASGRQIIAIETWNELGEASGILETIEYGRQYIEITRAYLDRWRAQPNVPAD
jgi:hypothetical protein